MPGTNFLPTVTPAEEHGTQRIEARRRFVHGPVRLAEPADVDPEEVPYLSLWTRTEEDPDPRFSPVLDAFADLVEAQDGLEDALWTAMHWAAGKVPVTALLPAPRTETRRLFVFDESELFALSASPEKGVRVQFPPQTPPGRRVEFIRYLVRVCERLVETGVADDFPDAIGDYDAAGWWREVEERVRGSDEPLGAVDVFFTVEDPDAAEVAGASKDVGSLGDRPTG